VPERPAVCGLPGASELMLTEALRGPPAVGPKVIMMVQVPLAANVDGESGQLFVCAKSPAFAPVIAMLVIVSAPLPEFVSTMFSALLVVFTFWLPKFRLAGFSETAGPTATPVPESPAVWGLPEALFTMLTEALRGPLAVGPNVIMMVQVPLAASVAGESGQL